MDTSLFVASAASQTLTHVLLFSQPVSTAGRNGVDEEEDGRTPPSVLHADVATGVAEYLKESVLPKESTRLHQSLRTLKLLALLLDRAGPALRDTLLQAVTASLEELVTAGCSQLRLPLMDVILAAHR